jgi:type VI secretion system protein VasG
MEDGEGRRVSFRNCLILLTSNVGDAEIAAAVQANAEVTQPRLEALVRDKLRVKFPPALLARMQVVAFRPLGLEALAGIARQALAEVGQRLAASGLAWRHDTNVPGWVAQAVAQHPASGRAVRDLLREHVVPHIAQGVLMAQVANRALTTVRLSAGQGLSLSFDADALAEDVAGGDEPGDVPGDALATDAPEQGSPEPELPIIIPAEQAESPPCV